MDSLIISEKSISDIENEAALSENLETLLMQSILANFFKNKSIFSILFNF